MEELIKRLDNIERQNKEILALLRSMKAAEKLEEALENMRRVGNLQPNLQTNLQPFSVLKVGKG